MNTVPGWARATLDIRSSVPEDLDYALPLLGTGGPYDGVSIELTDRGTWPPMPRHAGLVDLAFGLAAECGLDLGEELSGGVSDGCWTGAWGVPTIDGLGPVGGHDHTVDEWIEIETLERRIDWVRRLTAAAAQLRS
jgi:glutamate carboxypeptidase